MQSAIFYPGFIQYAEQNNRPYRQQYQLSGQPHQEAGRLQAGLLCEGGPEHVRAAGGSGGWRGV